MRDRDEAVDRFNNPEDPFEDKHQSFLVNGHKTSLLTHCSANNGPDNFLNSGEFAGNLL